MEDVNPSHLLDEARVGFAGTDVSPPVQEQALEHLQRWLQEPGYAAYRPQIVALLRAGAWPLLIDCFYQVLPFGTGGRRGTVGIGPNRFNPWSLGASVQGHAAWLRRTRGQGELSVVLAYDVRRFADLGGHLVKGVRSPVDNMSSHDFARISAEIYAAAGIVVHMAPPYMSTPELSFAIRMLQANGGLNISASHNPPDDNGGKFYTDTGAQQVPPNDEEMAREVSAIAWIERMPFDRAKASGLVREVTPEVHEAYLRANLAVSRVPTARSARVVFTPLHGTGRSTVLEVLRRAGFKVDLEPSQSEYDGAFTHVPFRVPNPEVPRSMDAAAACAEERRADLVMATDPDADRLGLMVRHRGAWRFVTGNEIAALVCHHALMGHPGGIVIKTEVTTSLVSRIALARGARVRDDLLVGFKYIGDGLDQLERTSRFGPLEGGLADFAAGLEESHGVLVSHAVRDKDAAGGALLLAELASIQKDRGQTLIDLLEELWSEVGYVGNVLRSTIMRGATGRARIQTIQASLRGRAPTRIAGLAVQKVTDRQDPAFGPILSETDHASRDVLVFHLEGGARVILRPSGTEPKNKIYVEVPGEPGADLPAEISRVDHEVDHIADAFIQLMLERVDLDLPTWALRVNDLVPIENKLRFAQETLPGIARRLDEGESVELTSALRGYGRDAHLLLAPAVQAWIEQEQPDCAQALSALFSL